MKIAPLLPCPRVCRRLPGCYTLPTQAAIHLDSELPRETVLLPIAGRLRSSAEASGVKLEIITGSLEGHPRLAGRAIRSTAAPDHPEGHVLSIGQGGILIHYREAGGLRAAVATLRQLLREHGRRGRGRGRFHRHHRTGRRLRLGHLHRFGRERVLLGLRCRDLCGDARRRRALRTDGHGDACGPDDHRSGLHEAAARADTGQPQVQVSERPGRLT